MKRTPVFLSPDRFPPEFRPWVQDAALFDSSCSEDARVWFLDREEGFYLKEAPAGSLGTEAQQNRFFFEKGLGPEVLDRIGAERQQRLSCRILLMGGSNDVFFSGTDAQARANMAGMCQRLMGEGLEPFVGISLPVDWIRAPQQWAQVVDFQQAARQMQEYTAWLKQFCSVFGLPVVDFARDFTDEQGDPIHELFLDGLHPNAQGHRLMADRLKAALLPARY